MKYKTKEVKDLTDMELEWAKIDIDNRHEDVLAVRNSEAFKKKMGNRPLPDINPAFLQLQTEINQEIEKRQKV